MVLWSGSMFSTMGVELSVPSSERLERLIDLRGDNFEIIPPSQDDMLRQIPCPYIKLFSDTGVVLFTSAWSLNVWFGTAVSCCLDALVLRTPRRVYYRAEHPRTVVCPADTLSPPQLVESSVGAILRIRYELALDSIFVRYGYNLSSLFADKDPIPDIYFPRHLNG